MSINVFNANALVFTLCLVLLCSFPAAAQQVPFFVIVHPDNEKEMMSRESLTSIFLGTTSVWGNGVPIEPIDLDPASSIREWFSKEIHNRSTAEVQAYWQQLIAAGAQSPPPEVANEEDVVGFVRQHPGAIAYVSTSASFDGVKIIALVRPPVAIKKVPPVYTRAALRRGAGGDVVLRLQISEEGTVDDVEVLQGLGFGLTEEAIRAVRQWEFQPATSTGMTISAEIDVTVTFASALD